ncbi:MAG: polysaccharide deacetylase family protein [Chitinispirillaceae bacterium]|nr:polysaccharide deacetylase family protein [Chitinispirillaceae bacterium]
MSASSSILLASFLKVTLAPLFAGAIGAVLAGRTRPRPIPGLLFHSIDTGHFITMSALSRKLFERFIRGLVQASFRPVTISEAQGFRHQGDRQPLLLTFDDGCRSFYRHALPVLADGDYKVTLFPVAGYLGRTSSWDILPAFHHLSAPELREISAQGHEIGSHTLSHPDLTLLETADLVTELRDSKRLLEDIVGKSVTALSFPFGSWNRRIWNIAGECGYTHATIYRRHREASDRLFPVHGVYRFDTLQSVLDRVRGTASVSVSTALAVLMSHFARGAPLWKFRDTYRILPSR